MEYKGFEIKPHNGHPRSLVITKLGKGGSIPKVFDGLFTDKGTAVRLIDTYLASKGA